MRSAGNFSTEAQKGHNMTHKQLAFETTAKTIIRNLEARNMEGYFFENSKDAVAAILEMMPKGSTVTWGGSETFKETGMFDALKAGNYELIDRTTATTDEERRAQYGQMTMSDYFFMSSNAVTMDGELVNIDGRANRVSCLCWGPQNVIVIAGMNKVCSDVENAIQRVRDMAAPPNCVRLNKNTPCAQTGKCGDCYSQESICSQFLVTRRSSTPNRIKVILVGEELGY